MEPGMQQLDEPQPDSASGSPDGLRTSTSADYLPVAALSAGSFSSVYKCLDKHSPRDRFVEVKLVPKRGPKTCEVLALTNLKKINFFPQLVEVFESMTTDFIVTEYGPHVSLRELVLSRYSLSEAALMFYVTEMFVAVSELQKFVIHRDIKPSNVMLGKDGHIVIAGFGEAVSLPQSGTHDGLDNRISGPMDFCARELIMGDRYNHMVDWWSFAMTAYYLASGGKHAFLPDVPQSDYNILPAAVVMGEPRLDPRLPRPFRALVEGMLRRHQHRRIGYNGFQEIGKQPYFKDINWLQVQNKVYEPPFYPQELGLLRVEQPVSAWPADID